MSDKLKVLSLLLFFLVMWGCGQSGEEAAVARVGGRVLTLARVRQEIPSELPDSLTAPAAETFVNQWIEDELLLLEAHHRRLEDEIWLDRAVETYRRKLLISRLLDQELLMMDTLVTNAAIAAYYQDHQEEFIRGKDEVLMAYLISADKDVSARARSEWVDGEAFSDIVPGEMSLWGEDSVLVSRVEMGSLEKMIFGMGEGMITGVESLGEHWVVFKVYRHYDAGSVRELPEVAQEIRARLLAIARREAHDRFLEELRTKYPVEVNEHLLP